MYALVRIAFLFIVLSCSQIFSQNYLPLFSGYIPDSVMKDDDFKNQVDINIRYYAGVNPDLVYYYIMYVDKRFGENIFSADSNYYNLLREKDYEFRNGRNEWVENEMKPVDNILPGILSSAIKRYLSDLYKKKMKKYESLIELPVDENLLNYFSYLIASRKKTDYDNKTDYKSKAKQMLKEKSEYFKRMFSEAKNLDQSQRYELVESSLNFPYLFSNGYLEKYKQNTELHLYKFINKMIKDDYVQRNSLKAGIFYFKTDFKNSKSLDFTEEPFPYFHLESKDEVKIGTGIFLDLGFRLGLRNYRTPFSYVEVDAGYGITTDFTAEDNIDPFIIHMDSYQPLTGTHTIVTYTLTERNESRHYELYGRVSTPVYYFTRNLFIEASINYFYTSVKRNCYDFTRQIDSIISNNPDDFQEYKLNYSYEFRKGNFYPSIGFNYSLFEFLNVKAEYMIPIRLIAKMEVLFNF